MSPKPKFHVLSPELRAEARIARRRFLYGESGNRIGESHPRADLSDHEVQLLLELRDEGMTLQWLAEKFEVGYYTVRSICSGRTRGVPVARIVEK